MFRRWLSNILKKNRSRFFVISLIAIMVVVFILAIMELKMPKDLNNNTITKIYDPSKTVISGKNVEESELKENEEIIGQFVDYCNNKKYEEAYELLTYDCREALYPNLEKFVTTYCNRVFDTYKEYNIQSWINNENCKTYKIRYIENSLSTGNYTDSKKYEDYITIVKTGETQKLNINQYIGRQAIYKEKKTDEIDILVETVDIFLEKEVFTLSIKNKTQKPILLDGLRNSKIAIGLSVNGNILRANKYELSVTKLTFQPGTNSKIVLEFANSYSKRNIGEKLILNDIILDTEEFRKDKDNYNSQLKIQIKL